MEPRSFLLRPEPDATATFTSYRDMHWRQAQAQEEAGEFTIPSIGTPLPSGSFPGQEAAKAAKHQGTALFRAYHARLFKAFFQEHRNLTERAVLEELAAEVGLDLELFRADLQSGACREEVIADHLEAVSRYGITGIPTVIVDGKEAIVGAVPTEVYRSVITRLLEAQP